MAVTLSDWIGSFLDYYNASIMMDTVQIPYVFVLNSAEQHLSPIKLGDLSNMTGATTTTLYGYNNRQKQSIVMTRTEYTGLAAVNCTFTYTLTVNYYLYDFLWEKLHKNPWELGFARDLYTFEDTLLFTTTVKFNNGLSTPHTFTLANSDEDPSVALYYYDLLTGKKFQDAQITIKDATGSDFFAQAEGLFSTLSKLAEVGYSLTNPTIQYLSMAFLDNQPTNWVTKISEYTEITAESYQVVQTVWKADNISQTFTDTMIAPIPKTNRVTAFDSGTWSNYPLGSTPDACVARILGIPFNNANFSSASANAGVLQIIAAVERDCVYNFETDPTNALISLTDLRNLAQAVDSYVRIMATGIISSKMLPRQFQGYVAAKIAYALFDTYPLPVDLHDELLNMLPYIAQDYSITETAVNLYAYYERYRAIYASFGKFYTTASGNSMKKLGIAEVAAQRVLDTYKDYRKLFLELDIAKEYNILAQTSKSTGSIELLDKSMVMYPKLEQTVYLGLVNSEKFICTNTTLAFNSNAQFTRSADFVKRLVI